MLLGALRVGARPAKVHVGDANTPNGRSEAFMRKVLLDEVVQLINDDGEGGAHSGRLQLLSGTPGIDLRLIGPNAGTRIIRLTEHSARLLAAALAARLAHHKGP